MFQENNGSYKDICLIPNFFDGSSRSDLDVSCKFLGKLFKLPVVPANMACVIDERIAKFLAFNDYFYIMHRFFPDPNGNLELVKKMNQELWPLISISVGVKESDKEFIKTVAKEKLNVDFITVDVAHGHSQLVRDMVWIIKDLLPVTKIIAGNVCTSVGAVDLIQWGADCVKIGIAQGGACSTFGKTGFGLSMPDTIVNVYRDFDGERFPLIIDGGIRTNGDIAKAITLAYNNLEEAHNPIVPEVMVMCGSLFASCSDSPAPINPSGYKIYYGSASEKQKGHKNNVEGFEVLMLSSGMTVKEKLIEIKQDLQSSVSYAGGKNLKAFANVEYF